MKRYSLYILIVFVIGMFFAWPASSYAKNKSQTPIDVSTEYVRKFNIVHLRMDHFRDIRHIEYALSYMTGDNFEGVVGEIDRPDASHSIDRSIYLGTCSAHTCITHQDVRELKLDVIVTYKNGQMVTTSYVPHRNWFD